MRDVCTNADMIALLHRAQHGDPPAFDRLYNLYADRIYRYLNARIGDREAAEDLTADVFVRMLRQLPRFRIDATRPVAAFSAWLYRIAGNLLTDHRRRQKHRSHLDLGEDFDIASDRPTPDQQIVGAESQGQLLSALSQLNEEQRRVIIHRFGDSLSLQEVADLMGKTEGAVKALQHRALAGLRRILNQEA